MKKSTKVIGIVSLSLILAGGILGIAGICMGGLREESRRAAAWSREINETYENVTGLDFDLSLGRVEIRRGDSFSIQGEGLADGFISRVENGIWKIETRATWKNWLHLGPGTEGSLVITLPEEADLRETDISMSMGELYLEGLKADEMQIEVGAGELTAGKLTAQELKVECGMGTVSFEQATVASQADLSCGMGNIEGTLTGKQEDYGYEIDCGMGNVRFGSLEWQGMGQEQKSLAGSGNKFVKIGCDMGEVFVAFEE